MRWTKTFIPTVKEIPGDAEVISHQLMIRAALIRKVASGAYTYLPLGFRSLRKAAQIVREEMDRAGALEIVMPILQPMELWQQTGRDEVFKEILLTATDHHGRVNVFSPTAEEVVTSLAAEIRSFRQLPVNFYQIHDKFRDEFRPQYGVIRSREFLMKDAYSFDATVEGLNESYKKMYDAYCRIFDRAGLKYVIVQADSGGMGGTDTEEFMVPSEIGDTLVATEDGTYWANIEKAQVDPLVLSDAAKAARAAAPAMAEVHTPNVGTIDAVCKFLGTQPADMIKTLVYAAHSPEDPKRKLVVAALVRGDHDVNESKLVGATGGGVILELADEATIRTVTGAAVGFAGPMTLAGKVGKLVVDHAVAAMGVGVTGANKTDHHVRNVVPGRDFPLAGANVVVADIRNATEADTWGGKKLKFSHGLEIGHVFKLGTKYSEKLGARFDDEKGQSQPCIMGCYGVGVNRILACAIEVGHDDKGIIWPISIAPYEVLIVPVGADRSENVRNVSEKLYADLLAAGVDVLIDDREARPGVKFNDADLIGVPIRVTIGDKALANGNIELKLRREPAPQLVPVANAASAVQETVARLFAELK
ncbi:MAG: proline--tRNA ligase [Phycisphaerae bacterium]|nr:proline--tRNA ligase [Phycisphaerae bacterium]